MDINQLNCFISVAQTLNFSEAARRNYVSQSTVSRYISDLEKCINQPTIETLQKLLTPMGVTLAEFFNEDGEVSILTETEKELVAGFRTLPEDKADLALQMIKALNR